MWSISCVVILILTYTTIHGEQYPVVHFTVKEESALYTTVGNISAFLLPRPTIITDSQFFNVSSTGLVQLARRLDLEALCTEKFLCCEPEKPCELTSSVVVESLSKSRDLRTLEMRVQVLDANDNAPMFPSTGAREGQVLEVSESAKVGSIFDLVPAVDRDVTKANQIQRYALHGAELETVFQLDKTELSTPRLRLIRPLDYEQVTMYAGQIEACDPQTCTQQNLTILVTDSNDNRPVFLKTSYEVTIPENFTVGQTVLKLQAEDKDSPVNAQMDYRFHGEVDVGLQNTFRLERDTGRIVLRAHLAAHRRSEYRFDVSVWEASSETGQPILDGPSAVVGSVGTGNVASVVIHIEDLNDFSPSIKLFSPAEGQRLSVAENSPPTRVCVLQVSDNDAGENGRVSCRLVVHGNNPQTPLNSLPESLTLTSSGKMYTLSTSRPFDAEQESQITVTMACTDHGDPPRSSNRDLIIYVEDVNEYAPELDKSVYQAAIYENSQAGVEVVQIVARDQDYGAKLYYELSAEGKQYFKVDDRTGTIVTLGDVDTEGQSERLSTVLDREKSERITFTVCVTDGPAQGVCDKDGSRSAAQMKTQAQIPLVYTASATVVVTILDRNDNRPNFIEMGPFSVLENQPRFTLVTGKLLAIDADEGDNGRVRYTLRHTWRSASGIPAPGLFQVELDGRIRTLEVLDREVTNAYSLEVAACDSAPSDPHCSRANLTVTVLDENDNAPVWRYPHDLDKEVNITSDLPSGHVIARVHATDRDSDENGRIVYSLIDPLRRTVFQVDNRTGDIYVSPPSKQQQQQTSIIEGGSLRNDPMDKPNPLLPGVYRLRLKATDQGHPEQTAETWLQVNVFNADTGVTAGMNFMIIVAMVAVTGVISICLIVAIICVRRRSVALRRSSNSRPVANGSHRGRDAADGAEGSHFSLKYDYGGYPLDGGGYMMGVSPTPSDLDGLKLGCQTANTVPYFGMSNGRPESAHLIGWPSGAICYPAAEDQLNFMAEHGLNLHTTDLGPGQTIRLPVYAPYPLSSVAGSDMGSVRSGEILHSRLGAEGGCHSTICPNFSIPSSVSDQTSGATGLHTFGSSYSDSVRNTITLNEGAFSYEANGRHAGSDYQVKRIPVGHYPVVAFDAPYSSSRQCHMSHTSANGTHRRYGGGNGVGLPHHCELDVESADSGRGASEDDPSLLAVAGLGTQLIHVYPPFHHMNTGTNPTSKLMASDVNGDGRSHEPPSVCGDSAERRGSMSNDGHSETWNASDCHRLKC